MADPVSIQQLIDAGLDATTLAQVAMSDGFADDTTTNRDGVTIDTVQGRLKKLGYEVPVIYAVAISFTANDRTKTIDRSGVIYAPLPSELPFTTSGTWVGDDEDKFFVIQGLTKYIADSLYRQNYASLAEAVSGSYIEGSNVSTSEYSPGSIFGGATYDVVLTSSVTPNGINIIQSTGDPTLSLVLQDNGSAIIASQWGVLPGEIVDITTFKAIITESNSSWRDAQYVGGEYDFNNQNIMDGGLLPGQDVGELRVVGIPNKTIFKNIANAHYSGFVRSRYITYKSCEQPIYMTGNMTDMDIQYCEFEDFLRAIIHNDSGVGVSIAKGIIDKNYFHDSTRDDFTGCIILNRTETISDVQANNNLIVNVQADSTGSNIFAGILIGDDDWPATNYNRLEANNNTIINCGNAAATFPGGAPSFGIVLIGIDCYQNDNIVQDGKWLEPLYMKGNGNSQINNKMRDNQYSGLSMKVMNTTEDSKENVQDNNIVSGQCDKRAGIRMFGSGRSINSQVDITTTAQVDAQGGYAYQCTRSTTIDGKLTVTGQFKAPKGMDITTSGDIEIDVLLESEANGIKIIKSSDGNLENVSISGKVVSAGNALEVNWCEELILRDINIRCDRYDGNHIFALVRNSVIMDNVFHWVTDVASDGNPLMYPTGIYCQDGGDLTSSSVAISNYQFVTDRDLTQVFQFFAASGLVSPNEGKWSISDSEIDLNGNSCTRMIRTLTNMKKLSLNNVQVDGSITARTLEGSGFTVDKLLINECLTDYVATDDVAGHTNATVTASRIGNNKTA